MTSNECVVPVPPPNRDVKQNNDGQIERRNRRALVDIGNLAPTVVEIGKPNPISRPVTRSLKPQDETPRRRSKKPSKSLTTVLTARSKVACGITTRPKDPVVNIDEADINNELAEVRADSDHGESYSWSFGLVFNVPTPYVFLVRYTKASVPFDTEMENMVFFLTELGLIHYSVVITNSPSKLAASAVYAARCTLKKTPAWTETLKHHTGYYEDELRECAKTLVTFHDCASETKLKAVYRKYVNPEKGAVALFPPARDVMAEVGGGE
ncbi:putative cyclin domain-containing protein [Helianthus annuus]|nr:putative cyclin domain-containing protein [Helianthus annuus]